MPTDRKMILRTLLLCSACLALPVQAASIYTYTDAQGNRVFTDQPHKNAKRVDIAPTNNLTGAAPTRNVKVSPAKPPVKAMFHYELVRILAPEPDAALSSTEGSLIVTVTSDPILQPGHSYQLVLDGQPVGETGRSPVFSLNNIDRGSHELSVEIYDELGRLLEKTPSQPFHLQRMSLNQKRLANPCQTEEYGVRPECPIEDKPQAKSSWIPFL